MSDEKSETKQTTLTDVWDRYLKQRGWDNSIQIPKDLLDADTKNGSHCEDKDVDLKEYKAPTSVAATHKLAHLKRIVSAVMKLGIVAQAKYADDHVRLWAKNQYFCESLIVEQWMSPERDVTFVGNAAFLALYCPKAYAKAAMVQYLIATNRLKAKKHVK
jgi:hypothetical protein